MPVPKSMSATAAILLSFFVAFSALADELPLKSASTLYPPEIVARVRENTTQQPWAANMRDEVLAAIEPWRALSEDALWSLMFGPKITRSWMVWSNGHCPACKESVPMYNWKMDAMARPWKVWCPHCNTEFPTNDFEAYHRSGLDEHGLFDPARADRTLLFNRAHPDPNDPLHGFGVDDGEGYIEGDNRWRFIGAYLIYGQWKQAVLGGIRNLATAFLLTGDPAYAHKAAILLDRVADVYPLFDFKEQGLVYEVPGVSGYVSTWHDTCEETRELVMAYDMIFDALTIDGAYTAFLTRKAAEHGIAAPKRTPEDIRRNIESRILRDALNNPAKIHSNYPRTEIASAIIHAVLGGVHENKAFWEIIDPMLDKATAVDGVTGEKGLAGYASFTIQALALFLSEFSKADPAFLDAMFERCPRLHDAFRFHIDTLCLDRYYPQSGDCGAFAAESPDYKGMPFYKPGLSKMTSSAWTLVPPSSYTLLWRLYERTGDSAFAQIAYRGNGYNLDGLPHDIYIEDADAVRNGIARVIREEGSLIRLGSVNKGQWKLALLRSGEGRNARVVWLDYDSGGGHGHADAMNLGLFARGLDLMPEFGYPPVQFGGWGSPRARWYTKSAAHNTVVVDGRDTPGGAGEMRLWGDGTLFHAMRATAPALNQGNRFERTVALIDVSSEDFYVLDVFRVEGGADHTRFMHSQFGDLNTTGLRSVQSMDYGHNTQMRALQLDPAPAPGWQARWRIEDRYGYLKPDTPVHLRYTDFTAGAAAGTTEAWLVAGLYGSTNEVWIPRLVVRRLAEGEEALDTTTFAGIIEPYGITPPLRAIARIDLQRPDGTKAGDNHAGFSITLANEHRDILIARDPEDNSVQVLRYGENPVLETDAELAILRLDPEGNPVYAALCHGARFEYGALEIKLSETTPFAEFRQ